MTITVTRGVLATLLEEAAAVHPLECCGLLLGGHINRVDRVQPVRNLAADPHQAFELDPLALIAAFKAQRSGGPCVIGYYHSHPNGNPGPSVRDRAEAPHDGLVWGIIAMGEVFFWRDEGPVGFLALGHRLAD